MKSVMLLGGQPGHRIQTDYAGEVWGCNSLWKCAVDATGQFRGTRWFELHPKGVNTEEEQRAVWLCASKRIPIYLLDRDEWLRDPPVPLNRLKVEDLEYIPEYLLTFPVAQIAKDVNDYFCCTFAYQVALALLEGFEEIVLKGIDLTVGSKRERLIEKPNLEWWLGYAEGKGVRIIHPVTSMMSRHVYRYGYDYWDELDSGAEQVESFRAAPVETPPKRPKNIPCASKNV